MDKTARKQKRVWTLHRPGRSVNVRRTVQDKMLSREQEFGSKGGGGVGKNGIPSPNTCFFLSTHQCQILPNNKLEDKCPIQIDLKWTGS